MSFGNVVLLSIIQFPMVISVKDTGKYRKLVITNFLMEVGDHQPTNGSWFKSRHLRGDDRIWKNIWSSNLKTFVGTTVSGKNICSRS
jgi:hypothetical protein